MKAQNMSLVNPDAVLYEELEQTTSYLPVKSVKRRFFEDTLI